MLLVTALKNILYYIIMNLIEFLKTHSKISNQFIDDFFNLYDINNHNTFIINLNNVAN